MVRATTRPSREGGGARPEPISTGDLYISATTGNRAASEFWDYERAIVDPYVTVMPGRTVEYHVGFEACDGPLKAKVESMLIDAYTMFSER